MFFFWFTSTPPDEYRDRSQKAMTTFPPSSFMSSVRSCSSSWLHDRNRTRLSYARLVEATELMPSAWRWEGIWEVSVLEIHDALCDIRASPYVMFGRRPTGSGTGHRQDLWDPQVCLQWYREISGTCCTHVWSINAYKIPVENPQRDQVGNQELDGGIRLEYFMEIVTVSWISSVSPK